MVFAGLLADHELLQTRKRTERVDDDLARVGIVPQEQLAFGDVTRVVGDGVRDVAARQGRHGDDRDRAAVGQLHRLLVDLGQVGVERTGHRVLRRDLIHTVRHDGQRIGIERHVGQQDKHLLALVHREVLGGRKRHVGDEQPLHGRVLGRIDERHDAVEGTGVLEHRLEIEEVVVGESHAAQDDLVGLGTQRHIGHHGVIGLVGVGEERDLLPRHDRIVQVDAGNTRGDQLRRLDTAVRVYRRAADLARLALDDLTAFERLAVGVEEASREVVRHAQLGRFAVEDHFRVGRQSLGTRENLQRHVLAHDFHHLRQLAAHGGQLVVADALRPQGHGRLGDVIDFGIYFLKSSCCHGLKLILFFHSHTPRSASGSR